MKENSIYDKKSLREITGTKIKWDEIAKDCVAFSNAQGGYIDYGIEDSANEPPTDQRITETLVVTLQNKINEKTVNVNAYGEVITHNNGGQFLRLHISRGCAMASTRSGKYFVRIGDNCTPIIGSDINRIAAEKGYYIWESQPSKWSWKEADKEKLRGLLALLQTSDRVSNFVKQKETKEQLIHYGLIEEESDKMTYLGVLFIGTQSQRSRLLNAPVVQVIKYDEDGDKVKKYLWDDYTKTPYEMIVEIWENIPDWQETIEINDGLFRKEIPAYDKNVIRELVCNALVHRPYTILGDIFINIHPKYVEVVNPGLLPLGVTPENILHKTVQRNRALATLCFALKLMEREGSGYDKMYEIQLSQGKQVPKVIEGDDYVKATVERRIISQEAIKVIQQAMIINDLKQKQIICLGMIVQAERISASTLIKQLCLKDRESLSPWLNKLIADHIVESTGKNRAKEYQVNPEVLKGSQYKGTTSLKRIEDYRIRELIIEDLRIFECASLTDIHQRIGKEIKYKKVLNQIKALIEEGIILAEGANRWTKYILNKSHSLFQNSK